VTNNTKWEIDMIESYANYADYLAWADKRKIEVTQSESEIDAALYIATNDYIDIKYKFRGQVEDEDQLTSLPTDEVSINRKVIAATCECAYLYLNGKLFNNDVDSLGAVKSISINEKLDVLGEAVSKEYWSKSSQSYLIDHPQIDRLLADYVDSPFSGGLQVRYQL
jgi:hypothetical protein